MNKPYNDRMARPETRTQPPPDIPRTPLPVERKLVQPPPEMRVSCKHCGGTRWSHIGSMPESGGVRRRCLGCGLRWHFSDDGRTMRLLG
jgi:hypothetical protein